jgi:hypothetical protein
MIWADCLGLEIIGAAIMITLALEVVNAVLVLEEVPMARTVIVAGALFTAGLLLDISVFVGGVIGGAGLGGLLCAILFNNSLVTWIGAIFGGLPVILNFFVDITICKADALNHPLILRKEDWLFPVLFGTSLSNGALVPFNMAIGLIKGVMVTLLILAKLLPLILGAGLVGLLTRAVIRVL